MKHLVLTLTNITDVEVLKHVHLLEPVMDNIARELDLHIVGRCKHQFKPYGATLMFLLEESHLAVHTYWETSTLHLDIFCCNPEFSYSKAISVVMKSFPKSVLVNESCIDR
jgi:S-adenosylmethionine/arginine decarboxylase-like enzyme